MMCLLRPTVTRAPWLSPYLSSMRADIECLWTGPRIRARTTEIYPLVRIQ